MPMNKALEMAGNMFTYENPHCDCKVTTNYTNDGVEYHRLQLKAIEGFHKYAYAPIDGLVMIDSKTGAVIEKTLICAEQIKSKSLLTYTALSCLYRLTENTEYLIIMNYLT